MGDEMTKFAPFQRKIVFGLFLLALRSHARSGCAANGSRWCRRVFGLPVPCGGACAQGRRKLSSNQSEIITNATIIIRNGFIEAVGTGAVRAAGCGVIWDMQGELIIYAGFIDPYLTLENKSEGKTNDSDLSLTGGGIGFFGVNKQGDGVGRHHRAGL